MNKRRRIPLPLIALVAVLDWLMLARMWPGVAVVVGFLICYFLICGYLIREQLRRAQRR